MTSRRYWHTPSLAAFMAMTGFGATALAVWVLVMAVIRGSLYFAKYGMSAWQIIAGYYVAALMLAILLRLLWPLTRWAIGALATGALAGTLLYGTIGFLMD